MRYHYTKIKEEVAREKQLGENTWALIFGAAPPIIDDARIYAAVS
jgi:hypothetical protein